MFRRQTKDAGPLSSEGMESEGMESEENLPFFERIEREMARKKKPGKNKTTVLKLIIFIMVFQTSTELYTFKHYVIPYMFQEYGPWTMYYMNVLIWFIVINMLANWFCVMLYNPAYPKTKDNPFLEMSQQDGNLPDQFAARIEQATGQNGVNGHCVYDMTAKEGLPWNFCEKCSMQVPFRAHHCDICKACVLKRDHHCYMVGTCIGFNNQRYWIILTFYVAVNGIFCGYLLFKYTRNIVWPELEAWTDLVFPFTIWRSVFGNIKFLQCILILQLYIDFIFGFLAFLYFNAQLVITAEGKTLYEAIKKVPIINKNSVNSNMKSVFGDFWALNFFFPMTLIFRQRDDGIHWDGFKIHHNINEKRFVKGNL